MFLLPIIDCITLSQENTQSITHLPNLIETSHLVHCNNLPFMPNSGGMYMYNESIRFKVVTVIQICCGLEMTCSVNPSAMWNLITSNIQEI